MILYGPSGHAQKLALARYEGKPYVAFDLGYWDRNRNDYALRVSINGKHPAALPDYGNSRWDNRKQPLLDYYDPQGHCLVAGTGRKSVTCNGLRGWDLEAQDRAERAFPGMVHFRPKPNSKVEQAANPIEAALRGCAYVVTHHSNVGIDAVLHGIPVASEEGAVTHLYQNRMDNKPATEDARLDFLRRLAWWNWKTSEARSCWEFLQARIREVI